MYISIYTIYLTCISLNKKSRFYHTDILSEVLHASEIVWTVRSWRKRYNWEGRETNSGELFWNIDSGRFSSFHNVRKNIVLTGIHGTLNQNRNKIKKITDGVFWKKITPHSIKNNIRRLWNIKKNNLNLKMIYI